ncbi:MAG: hypothetical protein J6Y60_02205 [Treponema sp.]|nr:hypothetical protein [Treponema sp.]
MQVENFLIDDEYLIRTYGTSDGTQDKFYKDGFWFKLDRYGGEGLAETAASIILKEGGLSPSQFVEYLPCVVNGKNACYSKNFLKDDESFITFYRLYKNVTGRDLAQVCSTMDYDDAIEYVMNFVKQQTNLDIHEYLANTFALDRVILNEDRHFNNLGIIYDGTEFKTAPIFDNGKSFLIGNKRAIEENSLQDKIKTAHSKAFSPSFELNYKYLKECCTLTINESILEAVRQYDLDDRIMEILSYTI